MVPAIVLRDAVESDLPTFFDFQLDPEANRLAAFTAKDPNDRAAFDTHWHKILNDPSLIMKTIEMDGEIVGSLGKFVMFDLPQVTYWIGRQHWGKGIATAALSAFLNSYTSRPIYACAAFDNKGSIRVLQKCGFIEHDRDRGFANARNAEIEEIIFRLD